MPTPTKVNARSHKVKWALDDIICAVAAARNSYEQIEPIVKARRRNDLTAALLELHKALAEIELKAIDARRGEYRG